MMFKYYNCITEKWTDKPPKLNPRKEKKYYHSQNWKGLGLISSRLFSSIKYSAKRRGIPFNITIRDAWRQFLAQEGKCALSGRKLKMLVLSRNETKRTASLDRKNSKYGYTRRNCQWVEKRINSMKQGMDNPTFVRWCNQVAQNAA